MAAGRTCSEIPASIHRLGLAVGFPFGFVVPGPPCGLDSAAPPSSWDGPEGGANGRRARGTDQACFPPRPAPLIGSCLSGKLA